ncbi:MAG TPA: 50S ribosomal protein L9, partial [Spirochaetota bacterium]|nr:50S ribosomal protein L9 [Spirochaetota bacterium]
NESSAKAIEHQKKLVKIKKEKRKKEGQKLVEALSSVALTIGAQVGEDEKLFGSVTAIDIADKLLQMGYTIDKRKIVLPEPIKKAGEHEVKIKLEEGLTATIKVNVVKE